MPGNRRLLRMVTVQPRIRIDSTVIGSFEAVDKITTPTCLAVLSSSQMKTVFSQAGFSFRFDALEGIDQRPRADAGVSPSPVAGPPKENENTANTWTAGA